MIPSTIVLLGTGNVAMHLGNALVNAGHRILQVYGRNPERASALAAQLQADPVSSPGDISGEADIYLIAVRDEAVAEVVQQLNVPGKIVAHTSGTLPLSVISSPLKAAVFYPLQTFTADIPVRFADVPLCLEAEDPVVFEKLKQLALSLSKNVQAVSSENRKILHIAAVFASNFTNHLYKIAADLLEAKGLSFDLLKPLIRQTAEKVQHIHPAGAQTGPAKREDRTIIREHLSMLEADPDMKQLYRLLSRSIQRKK